MSAQSKETKAINGIVRPAVNCISEEHAARRSSFALKDQMWELAVNNLLRMIAPPTFIMCTTSCPT